MKVIFLDFDGVLNSQGSFVLEDRIRKDNVRRQGVKGRVPETLCHVCTSNLQVVLDQYPEVKVVLSTTWRTMYSMDWLKEKLASYHIDANRVIDKTPEHRQTGDRGQEISAWLDKHPEVTHYIVIDDNDWGISPIHGQRFVKTTWESGMTFQHAVEAVDKLSNGFKKKLDESEKAQEEEYNKLIADKKDEEPS